MEYKNLGWNEYLPYVSSSEEIYLTANEEDYRIGLVNHDLGVFTMREGVDLGDFDIESDGQESYVDRGTVETKRLLAASKALLDEDMGADLTESFIGHYHDLSVIVEKHKPAFINKEEPGEYGEDNRPAIHLPSDTKLLTLIRQMKQAQRIGDKKEVSERAVEFIDILKQYAEAEPKPTGVREMNRILYKEIGLEFEPLDDDDKQWLEQNRITESVGSIDVSKRPSLTQTDKAYQRVLKNLHQAEVELNKAHHMSNEELIAKTLELVK